jgi:hypothetical protein
MPVRFPCCRAAIAAFGLSLGACTGALHVSPAPAAFPPANCALRARVEYRGAPDYVPAVLVDTADAVLAYAFTYEVVYGSQAIDPLLQFVNPLNFVGFPTGAHDVRVVARVDVRTPSGVVRSYAAAAAADATGTMFSEGATLTELRRRALLAVRDSLARQLCADADALAGLERAARIDAASPP